ncbi:RhoGEF [Nesidiocoris tenuis]|uniref:RhoGEF n=1 Tax=Nesidiocoris tenuis TaxID=355587 RepID=A0ABN7AIN4_9HEMI|nr:RhoGEF [Nesidiocoris tenuis]
MHMYEGGTRTHRQSHLSPLFRRIKRTLAAGSAAESSPGTETGEMFVLDTMVPVAPPEGNELSIHDVVELLEQKYAVITGGKTREGYPIISLPDNSIFTNLSDSDYQKLMIYLTSVPSMHEADLGFALVVDRRNDKWSSVKNTLQKISSFFPGLIHVAYVVRPAGFFQKAISEVSNKFLKEEFKFKVVVFSCVEDLHQCIDRAELSTDMDGTLPYSHKQWIRQRLGLEEFSRQTHSVSGSLDKFTWRLRESISEAEVAESEMVRAMLNSETSDYLALKEQILNAARTGEQLLSDIRHRLEPSAMVNITAVERLLVQLEETERTFDEFWEEHSARLRQCLDVQRFYIDYKKILAALEQHLKMVSQMTEIGETVKRVEYLINEFNALENMCKEHMEQCEEIINFGRGMISGRHYWPLECVGVRCDELERTCATLRERLEQRSNILTKSLQLLITVDKANKWCTRGIDLLEARMDNCACGLDAAEVSLSKLVEFMEGSNEFNAVLVEYSTPETKALVSQVLQRIEDVKTMCNKKMITLKRLVEKPPRPVQTVTPEPAIPLQPMIRPANIVISPKCGDCLRYAHLSCAGINDLELIFIKRLEKAWYCNGCLTTTFERKPTFRRPATERYKRAIIANKKSPLIETASEERVKSDQSIVPSKETITEKNSLPNSTNGIGLGTERPLRLSIEADNSTKAAPNPPTRIPKINKLDTSPTKSHDFGRPSKLANSSLNPQNRISAGVGNSVVSSPKNASNDSSGLHNSKLKASTLSRKPVIIKGVRPIVKKEPPFIEKLKTLRPVEKSNAQQSMRRSVSEMSVFLNDKNTQNSPEDERPFEIPYNTISEENGSTILNKPGIVRERSKVRPRPRSVVESTDNEVPPFIQKLNSLKPVKLGLKSSSSHSLAEPTEHPWERPNFRRVQSETVAQETTVTRKNSTATREQPLRKNMPVVKTSSYAQFLKTYSNKIQNKRISSARSSESSDYVPAEDGTPENSFPSQETKTREKSGANEESNKETMNGINLTEEINGLRRHSGSTNDHSVTSWLHDLSANNLGILESADHANKKTEVLPENAEEHPITCNGNDTTDGVGSSVPLQGSIQKPKRKAPPIPPLQKSSDPAIQVPLDLSSVKVVNDHSVFSWFHEVSLGGIGILKSFNEAEESVDSSETPLPENKVPNEARDAAVEKEHEIKRGHILAELLETERIYVSELESIVKGYKHPMLAEETRHLNSELDGKSDIIFGNLEEIYTFHNDIFLTDLENCISTTELVALCFTHRKDALHKLYSCYCQNTPRSERHREAIGDHPFLRTCQTKLGHKLPLAAYLLKPVQRITKYRLLLEDLLNHSEGKKWCCELQEALDCMLAVLKCVNDSMHQTAITGFWGDLGDLGDLLMQGGFSVWTESKKDRFKKELRLIKPMQRHLFLYQKALLMCKKTSVHSRFNYQFKKLIKMSDVGLTETVKDTKTFEVWLTGRSEVHTIQAATVEQKIEWVDQIKSLLLYQLTQLKMKQHSKAGRSMSLDHYHGRSSPRAFSCDEGKSSKAGAPSDEETASSDFSNSDDEETFTTQVSHDSNIAIISSQGSRYRVLADYTPFGHNELPMKEGDIVTLLKVGCAGWWYVRLSGAGENARKEGWAPAAYLEHFGRKTSRSAQSVTSDTSSH